MKRKILVVDDEPQIRKQLMIGLGGYGFEVLAAPNGHEALVLAAQRSPAAVILDISLGSAPDGIAVCRDLRQWSSVPIIMLSVDGEEKTIVDALNAGADDYLRKPFGMEELHARIQALLRRVPAEAEGFSQAEVVANALRIDLGNHLVFIDDEEVHLTPKEFELLRLLATHPGKVMTHRAILNAVWGPEYGEMDHYVRVFVNQLRKKLRENPARNIRYITNEPGIGYRFVARK